MSDNGLRSSQTAVTSGRVEDNATMHALIYASSMELVRMCQSSRQAFNVGIDYISRAKEAISSMTVHTDVGVPPQGAGNASPCDGNAGEITGNGHDQPVRPPGRVVSRGRPKQSRYRSPIEMLTRSRKRKSVSTPDSFVQSQQDGDPSAGTDASKTDGRAKARKCHMCGQYGHYRNTCGRKSTYAACKTRLEVAK